MINNVNLMAPAQDLQQQQLSLQQTQKLAELLLANSLKDDPSIIHTGGGNPFARDVANTAGPISGIAQALAGRQGIDRAQAGQAQIAGEVQRRQQAALPGVLSSMTGSPEEPVAADQQGPPRPAIPPNLVEALLKAKASGVLPDMEKHIESGMMTPKDVMTHFDKFDPASIQAAMRTQNPAMLQSKVAPHLQDNKLVFTQDGKQVGPTTATDTFSTPAREPDTGLLLQKSNLTGEAKTFQGGNTTPINTRENALTGADVKQLEEGRKQYLSDLTGLGNISQLETDIHGVDPSKFGTLAEFRVAANKAIAALGGKPVPDNATMEAIHATAGNQLIEKVRALAPVTEEDVKLMKSIVGSEGNTKAALEKILDIASRSKMNALQRHRDFVESFAREQGVSPEVVQRYAPDFKIGPASPKGPSTNPYATKTDEEILKELRGG